MRAFRRFLLIVGVLFLASAIHAAPLERDLGYGLVYVRVRNLPADLPTKAVTGRVPPCVVDVRYVAADAEGAAAFLTWVKARATPRSPIFILANAETSAALRESLASHQRGSGIAVVGVPGKNFQPHVAVKTSPENERRAYDALAAGTPVAKLLADNPDKVRNDEASLSKDRVAEASADAATDVLTGKREPPPIDATLQRAVHLHRALVALRKI